MASIGGDGTSGRMTLPMNRGWLYSRTAEERATARDFNDAHFDRVVVPHTNIKLPWHGFDEQDYTFISTYRRHFKLPAVRAWASASSSTSKA